VARTVAPVLSAWWRSRKRKRRPAVYWLSYLDICISTQQKFGGKVDHLKGCAKTWQDGRNGHGDLVAMHPVGCGDRVRCPLCADYYAGTQAREAIAIIETLLAAADVKGIPRDTWGDAITLTLPKDLSRALDAILEADPDCAVDKVNKLRQAAWRVVRKAVKEACREAGLPYPGELAAVMVLHHWGSSCPWDPHWHIHIYLLPYTADHPVICHDKYKTRRPELVNWRSLPRWWSTGALEGLRASWKKAAERVLGQKYGGDWEVNRKYLRTRRQMLHYLVYSMRASLRDVWKGVRGSGGQVYEYWVRGGRGRPGHAISMTVDDFEVAYEGAERVRSSLTRITWYGYLSNVKQAEAMRSLGLEVEEEEVGDGEVKMGRCWRPVAKTALGVLFEAVDGDDDVLFVEWDKLCSEPVPELLEKPIGATRRRRWVLVLNKGSP